MWIPARYHVRGVNLMEVEQNVTNTIPLEVVLDSRELNLQIKQMNLAADNLNKAALRAELSRRNLLAVLDAVKAISNGEVNADVEQKPEHDSDKSTSGTGDEDHEISPERRRDSS